MATIEECEQALQALAERLAGVDGSHPAPKLDRQMSCTLRDLGVTFVGHLKDGRLTDLKQTERADAQVRLTMTSDDLVALVAGTLKLAPAWASKRIKVDANPLDLVRLRSIF